MDQDFQDWYQDDVTSSSVDDFAQAWEVFGDGRIFIPAIAGLGMVGKMYEPVPDGSVVGRFGCRTMRGYLVGAPPMVFMQYCLGGSRPGETKYESRWKPFDDANGVCGHGFVGAVPFITAAKMADNPCVKSGLYFCSILPTWARVGSDSHYLSQAWLGWWMAYLACGAVDQTNREDEHLTVVPLATPNMLGIAMLCEW